MFAVRIIQASYGDCFLLEYGGAGDRRFALIDGGPPDIYSRHLRGALAQVAAEGGRLDFVAISHVDSDHIIGVLDLFTELESLRSNGLAPLIDIEALWHNSFANTIDRGDGSIRARFAAAIRSAANVAAMLNSSAAITGISEGNSMRLKAMQLGIAINPGFPDDLIITDTAPPWVKANLSITFVGPSRANLDELRGEWEEWLDKTEDAVARGGPDALANSDKSLPNLSSVMFLAEADGKTALFTGDGRSDHLLGGLAQAGLLGPDGKLHVDILKVMHHGSDRNVTQRFFRTVTADTYIVSANGNPDNPDLATLIWIVEAARAQGRPIRIIFTNETPSVRKLGEEYPPATYGYTLEVMPADAHQRVLELAP